MALAKPALPSATGPPRDDALAAALEAFLDAHAARRDGPPPGESWLHRHTDLPAPRELGALLAAHLQTPFEGREAGDLVCAYCACVLHSPVVSACGIVLDEACAANLSQCPGCRRADCRFSPSYTLAAAVEIAFPRAVHAAVLCREARVMLGEAPADPMLLAAGGGDHLSLSDVVSIVSSADSMRSDRSEEPADPRWRAAATLLDHAQAFVPSSHAYSLRAQLLLHDGLRPAATAAVAEALKLAPRHPAALEQLAALHLAEGRPGPAFAWAAAAWLDCGQARLLRICEEAALRLARAADGPKTAAAATLVSSVRALWSQVKSTARAAPAHPIPTDIATTTNLRAEMECKLCLTVLNEPLTTPCGHSFCRGCLLRVLDTTPSCPLCRRPLGDYLARREFNITRAIERLVEHLYASELAERRVELLSLSGGTMPIFICSVALPGVCFPLHVFEPRYRLMMRRAMDSTRIFGMCAGTASGPMEYGTSLYINELSYTPDGRSFVSTIGRDRFKVLEWGTQDGYATAIRVEWIVDIEEPAGATPTLQELHSIGRSMVQNMHGERAWANAVGSLGEPTMDPILLPYWLSQAFGLSDAFQCSLLSNRSARDRYMQVLYHIRQMNQCRIL